MTLEKQVRLPAPAVGGGCDDGGLFAGRMEAKGRLPADLCYEERRRLTLAAA